jgi:hypothetical protein
MMFGRNTVIQLMFLVIAWIIPLESWCGEAADGKIKNGQLLIVKALNSSGEQKADYVYKAKREFERASLIEPNNPWPFYWNSVLSYYLERDSVNAAKLYNKALKIAPGVLDNYPLPWLYETDDNLKSAMKGDLKWVTQSQARIESPVMAKTETAEGFQSPAPISLLDSLSGLIKNNNLALADSLYSVLLSDADYDTSISLFLLGLELRLNEGFNKNCSDLLEEILNRTKKGSSSQKTAIGLYDKSIETYLIEAKSLENRGKYTEAATILEKMEPYRLIPASTARGNLHLQYSSVLLATNNPESADSLLKLYLAAGYRKSPAYKNIADRLAIVKKHKTAHAEIKTTRPDDILEEKPQSKSDQYIMMSPPQGDIIKVLVGSIDPMTGQIKETKLWETTGPLKMKTGAAYTLTVQRKHERKASLFIAAAGIVATFFIVR